MPLVWENVVRYSLIGSYGEQEVVNVLDVSLNTQGGFEDREEELFLVAGDILNNWVDHILPRVHANYQLNEVRWVDLTSEDGGTGSRSSTSENTLPEFGTQGGQGMPGNVYIKVAKLVQGKDRRLRNGMLRLAGVPEGYTADSDVNSILDTHVDALNDAFEDFKDGVNGGVIGGSRNLGVLHTINGTAVGFSRISEFNVRTGLGTIRRRMPGYGQ